MIATMAKKSRQPEKLPPLSEQLKTAILNCGETRYKIAKATGIAEATLSKYVNGHHYLAQPTIDVLCEYLGLRLVADELAVRTKKGR